MSETIEATGTALALLGERALVPAEVFKPGGVRVILDQIKAAVAQEKIDVTTPAGRDHCRTLARKIASSKVALDEMGKTLTEQWRSQTRAVNAERNLVEKELDALRDQVRAPLTAYEEREKKRVQTHEDALDLLKLKMEISLEDASVGTIDSLLASASELVTTRAWEEFQQRASELFASVNDALNDLRVQVVNRDKERAEAVRLHAEREEQARLAAVREQEAREVRLAAEAAEKARREAFAQAAREATETAQKAERDRQVAIRDEQDRHADELEAVHQLQVQREAEARLRYEAEIETQNRRAQAELARVQAEERAKAQKELDAKIAAETQAAKKREANVAHQRKINREARDAIEMVIIRDDRQNTQTLATAIVTALAKGEVPHAKLVY